MSYKISESIKVEKGKTYIVKERMQDIVSDFDGDSAEDLDEVAEDQFARVIKDEIYDTGRWSNYYKCVFKIGDKYYSTEYSVGATEMQYEPPYEYDGEWIEVIEVVPKEVTVIKYVPKKEESE